MARCACSSTASWRVLPFKSGAAMVLASQCRNDYPVSHPSSSMKSALSRRRFLRGLGIGIGLPVLECMTPLGKALAAATPKKAVTHDGVPLRAAFLYVPNGVNV